MLTETLVRECDGVHNNAVQLGNKLVVESEAKHAMEARAKAL